MPSWVPWIERFRENLDGAVEILKRGLSVAGEHETLFVALVAALNNTGNPEQAMELCRGAQEKFPDSLELASLACNTSHNIHRLGREEVFQIHRHYGEILCRKYPPPNVKYENTPDASRKLRIGFVSSDLRRHSVAFFIEPLLACLDSDQFHIVVYSTSRETDTVTERLQPLVAMWRDVPSLTDAQLAQRIYADQIDILVDLHGHTQGHRLGVFHNKPAPVQLTYLGYPNTSGLTSIDYRIVDAHTDPKGLTEQFHTEQLLRVDSGFLCYTPPQQADLPALESSSERPATFGCFNALHKLSEYSIRLWSQLLTEVPNSRMLIKCPVGSQSLVSNRMVREFSKCGIDPSRIEIMPPQKALRGHLAAYLKMDIALDPFPYCGTTTTCEALFMGVPVVSLAGDTHISRVGASILSAAGCPQWIARTDDEFVTIAAKCVRERDGNAMRREELRTQIMGSQLCDRERFGREMARVFRSAWVTWCKHAEVQ